MTTLPTDAIRWLIAHDSDCAEIELKAQAQLQALQDALTQSQFDIESYIAKHVADGCKILAQDRWIAELEKEQTVPEIVHQISKHTHIYSNEKADICSKILKSWF